MNDKAFTQEPLTYLDGKRSLLHIETSADAKVAGVAICSMNKKHEAYAKLFTAAPDLLEALRLALPYVEGAYECAFPDSGHNENVLEAVKAAIAKATT